jgi:hypothetical protein
MRAAGGEYDEGPFRICGTALRAFRIVAAYIEAITTSPNSEVFASVAPSIRRAKS